MYYIGIDPGQSGGIAIIGRGSVHVWAMPVWHKDQRKSRGGAIDWASITDQLQHITPDTPAYCMLEKVWGMPGQGATSTFSFGGAYHGMLAIIQSNDSIEYDLVVPRTWKNAVLGEMHTHDKRGAVLFCGDHYPSVNLILPRCRTPHDGMADALCLAHYASKEYEKHL